MKKKIVIPALIVVLLLCAGAATVYFLDLNRFKPVISNIIKQYTGRELTINGDIRLQAHWPLTLTVEDVAWQNAPWGSRPHMVRAKQAAFAVSIKSLLRGEYRFFKIRLQEPVVILEINQAGVSNFLLDIPDTEGKGVFPVLAFMDIFIQNGHFEYNDQRWNLNASVNVNELAADIPGLDKPIEILFKGSFRDLPFSLEGSIGPIMAMIQPDNVLPMDLSAHLGSASARLKGNVRDPVHLKGISLAFAADGPSTREMTGLIGRDEDPELGSFTAKAQLTDRSGLLAIENLAVNIGSLEQVSLSASGRIGNLIEMKGFDLDLGMETQHIGNLMLLAGLPPSPFEASLSAAVTFTDTADKQYSLEDFSISVGGETVRGRMDLDLTRLHTVLNMQLQSEHATLGPIDLKTRMGVSFDRVSVEHLEFQMGHNALFKAYIIGTADSLSPLEDLRFRFKILGNDLARLQKLTKRPLAVHGPYAVSGNLSMANQHIAQVSDLKIILGNNSIRGSLGLNMESEHPMLIGDLTANRLNLERLLAPGTLPGNIQKSLSPVGPSRLIFQLSGPMERPVLNSIEFQTQVENLASLELKGSINNLLAMSGTDLLIAIKGRDMANLKKVTGSDIPFNGPYALSCRLNDPAGQTYHLEDMEITAPHNTFSGRSMIQLAEPDTTLFVNLGTKNLSLEMLAEGRNPILDRLRGKNNLGPLEVQATAVISDERHQLRALNINFGQEDFVRMLVKGSVGNLSDLEGIGLDFHISGNHISDLETIAGWAIPIEGPYDLSGEVSGHAPGSIMMQNLGFTLGDNRFYGQANLNLAGNIPVIDAEISADQVSLAPVTIDEVDPFKKIPDLGPFKLAFKLVEKDNAPALTHLDFRLGRQSTIFTRLHGTVGSLAPLGDVFIDFEMHSQDLSILKDVYDSRYIQAKPFHALGRLNDPRLDKITLTAFEASYGDSDLSGTAGLDLTKDRPSLIAHLSSRKLDLRTFIASPSQNQPPNQAAVPSNRSRERLFSREPLDLAPLQQVDANVSFQGKAILLQRMALNDVDTQLRLNKGDLHVDPLKLKIGGGTAEGTFTLKTSSTPLFLATNLSVHHLDIGPMLEQLERKNTIQGILNTTIYLNGNGNSVAALMAGLNGKVFLDIHDGLIDSRELSLLERYLGSNVLDIINPFVKRPPYTTVHCLISNTDIEDGLATYNMVLDTEQTALASSGTINLKKEKLDIGIKPSPKKGFGDSQVGYISFSLKELSQPLALGGTILKPQLVLDPGRTVVTAAKFAGATLFGPVGITWFFTDISLGKKNICEEASQSMRKK